MFYQDSAENSTFTRTPYISLPTCTTEPWQPMGASQKTAQHFFLAQPCVHIDLYMGRLPRVFVQSSETYLPSSLQKAAKDISCPEKKMRKTSNPRAAHQEWN